MHETHSSDALHLSHHAAFLNPRPVLERLDTFIVRRSILAAICERKPALGGVLLDVGCGDMPYKSLILEQPSRVDRYIGLDVDTGTYHRRDVEWNGVIIPLRTGSIDCAMATEVLEHCPRPEAFMLEVCRVLKTGGLFFFTAPFFWPLHDVPHDEHRYTPFALERHLRNAGFAQVEIKALGGWDASLAQMIGLWVRRRPLSRQKRALVSRLALPIVRYLARRDRPPQTFGESSMITGVSGVAIKPSSSESI
jgi:SAM-dependent methyltransferase